MPWFQDFAHAAELARRQTRALGRADPVGRYFTALAEDNAQDARAVPAVTAGIDTLERVPSS